MLSKLVVFDDWLGVYFPPLCSFAIVGFRVRLAMAAGTAGLCTGFGAYQYLNGEGRYEDLWEGVKGRHRVDACISSL